MKKYEPGGGCALYVALTAITPSQRVVTSMAAVISGTVVVVVFVDVEVSANVAVVVEVHEDSLCWPETVARMMLSKLVKFTIPTYATYG
jgi:hypothetical protein